MKVGIAGIGGIGSNVARHLAQAGVTDIRIVDFDRVEASNLNRQFYRHSQVGQYKTDALEKNLKDIFPGMAVEAVNQKIERGHARPLFSECTVVVEGFDDRSLKKMLVEELGKGRRLIVSASGIAGRDMTSVQTRKMGCCRIVGDFVSDQDTCQLFPPKVAMVASIMAGIVLTQIREKENE